MKKFAPAGIVAQQFTHREIQNAVPGDVVGLVGSMQVDSVNFLNAPIGVIATISDDKESWVVVELFASMIIEQTAGTGGVTAGDWLKTAIASGAAADITAYNTAVTAYNTAVTAQATAQSTYNAAAAAAAADPTNSTLATTLATATTALNTAIANTASALATQNAAAAVIAGLAGDDNTVITATPGTTQTDAPLVWGRALNTAAAGTTVYVLPV